MSFRPNRVTGGAYSSQVSNYPIRSTTMYKGRAIGGPLNGINIESPITWDGKVRAVGSNNQYHQGRYYWDNNTWAWLTEIGDIP